jgi:predicted RND superfamily exporter protein
LPVSARAVFGSTMTTLVMFLSLATSDNGGLASLGNVGSVALFVTLVANLIWLPAALSWLEQSLNKRRPKAARSSDPAFDAGDEALLTD